MVCSLFQRKDVVLLPRFIRSDRERISAEEKRKRVVRFRQEGSVAVGFYLLESLQMK